MKQISITLPDDMADALLTNESFLSRCKELGIEVKEFHEVSFKEVSSSQVLSQVLSGPDYRTSAGRSKIPLRIIEIL